MSIQEVKRQVENALIVTARESGRMDQEKQEKESFNATSAETVPGGSVNHQIYQGLQFIITSVKYATS